MKTTRAWSVTIMAMVFMLINFADKAVLGLVAVPMMKDLGLSATEFGLAASSFYFLFNLTAVIYGFLATKWSPKWALFILAIVWTFAQLPLYFDVGFTVVILTRILLGMGEGPAYPMANHAVFQWFPPRARALPSAVLTVGVGLGGVFAAPILGAIIGWWGWRTSFLAMAVASLAWAILWMFLGKDNKHDFTREEVTTSDNRKVASVQRVPYRKLFLSRTVVCGVLGGFASYWGLATLIAWVPAYLEQIHGMSAAQTGQLIMLPWAMQAILTLSVGAVAFRLARRGGSARRILGGAGGIVLGLGGVCVIVFSQLPMGAGLIILMTLGFGSVSFIYALQQTSVSDITPDGQRSALLATTNSLLTLAGIIAPFVAGRLLDVIGVGHGGFQAVFMLAGALMIIGALVFAFGIDPERDAQRFGVSGLETKKPDDSLVP
jgi:MFS family permease